MVNRFLPRIGLAAILAAFSSAAFSTAQEEVDKQIAKLISDAISSRVSASVVSQTGAAMPSEPNNIWGSYGRAKIDFSAAGFSSNSRTNIYVGGYDRDITNSLILGASLSASDTNNNGGKSWGISPYLAYKFTNSFFGIATYSYSRTDFTGGNSDSNSLGASLNFVHRAGDFLVKGRVGITGGESKTNTVGFSTRSSSTSYVGDAEAGYFFVPGLYGFVGLQASDTNKSNGYNLFGRIGIEKEFNKNAAVSLRYEAKTDDNQPGGTSVKIDTWTLAARFRF